MISLQWTRPRDGAGGMADMVTDPEPTDHPPFGGFRIRTERMPDGRSIHYYEWPASGEPAPDPPDADAPPAGEPAE